MGDGGAVLLSYLYTVTLLSPYLTATLAIRVPLGRVLLQETEDDLFFSIEFLTAVRDRNLTGVQSLVEGHPELDLPNAISPGGTPALWSAAMRGDVAVAEYLLNNGARINAKNTNQTTPIYVAAQNGDLQMANLLIDAGANLNSASVWSSTPLSIAALEGHLEIVRRLLQEDVSESLNLPSVPQNQTPLWLASHNGHYEIVKLLLKHGAELEAVDAAGSTPLWAAAQEGQDTIVGLLLDSGADPNAVDLNGSTPLHAAAAFCHTSSILRLTEVYIDALVTKDKNQNIPADILCVGNDLTVQELVFMEYRIVPSVAAIRCDILDHFIEWYETADNPVLPILSNRQNLLHVATIFGNVGAVEFLIQRHPELATARDREGKIPLETLGEFGGVLQKERRAILALLDAEEKQEANTRVVENSGSGSGLSDGGIVWIMVSSFTFVFVIFTAILLYIRRHRRTKTEKWNVHTNLSAVEKGGRRGPLTSLFDTDSSSRASKGKKVTMQEQKEMALETWRPFGAFQFLDSDNVDITDEVFNLSEYESLQLGKKRAQQRAARYPDEGTSQAHSPVPMDEERVRSLQDFEISHSSQNEVSTGKTVELEPEMMGSWSTEKRAIGCHSITDQEEIVDTSTADTFSPRLTFMDFEDLEELRHVSPGRKHYSGNPAAT